MTNPEVKNEQEVCFEIEGDTPYWALGMGMDYTGRKSKGLSVCGACSGNCE